jgi:S-DNA-T family DNA segregation ATPase FtsK/SpoIIIE
MGKRESQGKKVKQGAARKGGEGAGRFFRPVSGLLLGGSALVLLLGLYSYKPKVAVENLAGPLGHSLAATLLEALGVGAWALAFFFLLCASALLSGWPRLTAARVLSWAVVCGGLMSLSALLVHSKLQGHLAGGVVGALSAAAVRGALSTAGAAVLLSAICFAALVVATDLWALRAAATAGRLSVAGGAMAFKGAAYAVDAARRRAVAGRDDSFGDEEEEDEDGLAADGDSGDGSEDDEKPARPDGKPRSKKTLAAEAKALALASADEPPQDPRLPVQPEIVEPKVKRAKAAAGAATAAAGPALVGSAAAAAPAASPVAAAPAQGTASPASRAAAQSLAAHAIATAPAPAAAPPPAAAAPAPTAAPAARPAPKAAGKPADADVAAPDKASAAAAEAGSAAPLIIEPKAPPKPAPRIEPQVKLEPAKPAPARKTSDFELFGGRSAFTIPPIDILTGEISAAAPIDRDGLTATAAKLRDKLASFGIDGQVTQIRPGPVVTMFEFLPAAGVKVSRIASLSDDLAMAMEAMKVRIVAPIPGKGVVGIEIPNKVRQTVVLRELVEQEAFLKSTSKLAMCLGKDIEGQPYIADLAKMPHLLIAGTTGSGKSVAVNSMIVSMLLRATPEEVRFLMVDPKMLELSVYEGIPHLLLPVVTDSKKAAMALRWGVEEMERRYQLLSECGVRDIASYNKRVEKEGDAARKAAPKMVAPKRVVDLTDPNLDVHDLAAAAARGEVTGSREQIGLRPTAAGDGPARAPYLADGPGAQHGVQNKGTAANGAGANAATTAEWLRAEMQARGEPTDLPGDPGPQPEPLKKLPYIVIIIDELADLMMVASREVETYIARLAQMARAAGIHLMVATQRPSTDVVTGVIKANFPSRISFKVASRHDSATIINANGAENLLGMGDMLILPPGTSSLTRIHGPFVDEKEIHAVVEHWKQQGAPVYDPNILKPRAEDGEGGEAVEDEGPDELYDQAIAALADMRFISISLLQRKLRVGYNRAARMIERMERDGIVGPADGAKPREVLIRALGEMPGAGA